MKKLLAILAFAFIALCANAQENTTPKLEGDANSDGNVSIADAMLMLTSVLNENFERINFVNADVNEDGIVNITDVMAVVKKLRDGDVPDLELSSTAVELTEGSASVDIISGSGSYEVTSSDPDLVEASIEGNKVIITCKFDGAIEVTPLSLRTPNRAPKKVPVLYNVIVSVIDMISNQVMKVNVKITEVSPVSYLTCPDDNHPHMINLGLPSGTLWSCCNVDAATPSDFGGYYAWGETAAKWYGMDGWESYSLYDGEAGACRYIGEDIAGTKYDVAHMKWGGVWRMPTEDQFKELLENCTSTWEEIDRGEDELPIYGSRLTAPNGGSIFLPEAGCHFGYVDELSLFWTSSFSSSDMAKMCQGNGMGERERWWGLSIRPVVGNNSSPVPISLAFSNVEIIVGGNKTVEITNGNGNYTVASSDEAIATATIDGSLVVVSAVAKGTAILTVTDTQSGQAATVEVTVTAPEVSLCPDDNHPHMIDLGLPSGTKWACCNVDTDHPENQSPTNFGGFYAWGETETKANYSWNSYIHCDNGSYNNLHALLEDIACSEYDVAYERWGKAWCMPSREQMIELLQNCSDEWKIINGIGGRIFKGPNGSSIFMPAAGLYSGSSLINSEYGYYWLSTRDTPTALSTIGLSFYSEESYLGGFSRCYGASIRPVVGSEVTYDDLALSSTSLSLFIEEESSIPITSGSGSYTASSSDESIATATIDGSSVIVTAVGEGTATITVTDTESGQTATIEVMVNVLFTLSVESLTLSTGERAKVYPNNGNGRYTCESSNRNVATVTYTDEEYPGGPLALDYFFLITAVSPGTATITVTDTQSGQTATVEVTVKKPLQLTPNELILVSGEETSVSIYDGSGHYTTKSSNESVVRVSDVDDEYVHIDGHYSFEVVAVGVGTATITVTDTESSITATIPVTVNEADLPLTLTSSTLSMGYNDVEIVEITSGYGNYTVTSSDEDVVYTYIEEDRVIIYSMGIGTATITVTDTKSGKTATIEVTAAYLPLILASSSLSMVAGNVQEVRITSGNDEWTVESSDETVATATIGYECVRINPVGAGVAIITVTDTRSGETATIEVTVEVLPMSLPISTLRMEAGKAQSLTIINGSGEYSVESGDEGVAIATIDGRSVRVEAVGEGTTTITLTDVKTNDIVTLELTVLAELTLCPDNHHPHLIDLGLPSGTKWACCNVDTEHPENQSPTNNGGYYAWGETEVKTDYSWSSYLYGSRSNPSDLGDNISGTEYDVAHVKWGGDWMMPTKTQVEELISNCSYQATSVDGISGFKLTGINGYSIFLPNAGSFQGTSISDLNRGKYRSSTPDGIRSPYLYHSGSRVFCANYNGDERDEGMSVRPVAQ